ncbi:MAG: chaperone modulator CbpM [Desulfuromonadales bacterium]|nr:chaperone modulator CbpM [Desulfuromonadales bacterium]
MKSEKPTPISGDLVEDDEELSLQELCSACELSESQVLEMVEHGVIDPVGGEPAEWRFVGVSLHRVRITRNLQRDLGVNTPGAALALELLEELEELRTRLRRLEK